MRDTSGATQRLRLDDVVNATATEVRARFRIAAASAMGNTRAQEIENCIDGIDHSDNAGRLGELLRAQVT